MARFLIVSDSFRLCEQIRSALDSETDEAWDIPDGRAVPGTVAEYLPDIVISDSQVGSMGAMAICMHIRLEESGGRLPHVSFLTLLDRRADVFLARRSNSDGWLVKPLDTFRIRRAIDALLQGGKFEDDAYKPHPVLSPIVHAAPPSLRADPGSEGRS